jgi:hypothetical protein
MTAIAAIDAQIARLESHSHDDFEQGRLLELRKERNALTPFGNAPEEIISHILAEMVLQPSWNPHSFFHLESFAISQEWTRAMLLCSRIRSVALATRELWSYIDCSAHPSWIVLCLQRVGNASLTLMRIRSHIRSMIYAITDSPSNAAIEVYERDLVAFDGNAYVQSRTSGLALVMHPEVKIRQLSWDTDFGAHLGDSFLLNRCQHLTHLELMCIVIDKVPALPCLTHLHLELLSFYDVDYGYLLAMISNAPLLEVLVLIRTGRREDEPESFRMKIRLPHLRVLVLEDVLATVNLLHLALPDPAELLSLTVDRTSHTPLGIPTTTEIPSLFISENIFKRVQSFWAAKSGGGNLFPYQVSMEQSPARIFFGMPSIDETSPSPAVHLSMECEIGSNDSMLEHVHTLSLHLGIGSRPGLTADDAVEPRWFRAISSEGYLPNIRHIIVVHMTTSPASALMESWLLGRHQKRRTLETLTFQERTEDCQAWAYKIHNSGLVKHLRWENE